ncbi:nucleotide-binding alpha-beta plait domain-containing protein [Tanacetum coccineum]
MVAISKEEEVQKISTSIFVTNFPDHAKAKDLWNVCKQYGQVVDAFIPDRKSKAGKRYGFVRFIRVYDVDRLVSNLCTLWMGSHHLHANVARFQRPPAVNSGGYTHQNGNYVPKKTEANSNNGHRTDKRSYVNVVNGDTKSTEACEPALLLDESCLNQLDYSLGLLGKVKEFSSFDNMRMVLGNEGFDDINLRYMGGMWIMIDFKTEDTKAKFQSCLGATSWFSLLIQASKEFVIDERITWVDIEGIPLKLWSESTFNRIAAKWGKMLYLEKLDEGCLYSKRLCILTTGKSNILETFKIIHKGKRFLVRAKETMGWIPDFDEQEEDNSESEDEQSVGFIKEDFDGSDVEKEGDNNVSMVPDSVKEDVDCEVFLLTRAPRWRIISLIDVKLLLGHDKVIFYNKRMEIIKDIKRSENVDNLEGGRRISFTIKWADRRNDENTKFYHGIINKKRNQLGIVESLKDSVCGFDNPAMVKKESSWRHFSYSFQQHSRIRPSDQY